jgi:putative DNA primase/helicase
MSVKDFAASGRRNTQPTGDWRDGLTKGDEGAAHRNLHNACVALRDHPAMQGKLGYDEFHGCTYALEPLPWDNQPKRPWTDIDDLAATSWLQSSGVGIRVGSGIAREAVQRVAYERRFHPVLDWLESLEWDGVPRLDTWLTTYLGVPASPLVSAIGRKFPISAVARIQKPGCKVDHVPILEGQQGAWKSKSLRALVGDEWFSDQIADLGTKDSSQDLCGVWVVELSELSAIRPGETEKVKAYISRQVDHYRPSYGRRSINVPRQCVFIGTTNAKEYLSDSTGNRRYWPVTTTKLDIEAIARDRDQLWAEAVAAYHAGETWWLEDDELRAAAEIEQEKRRNKDPWESMIADWLDSPSKAPDRDGFRAPLVLEGGRVSNAMLLEHAICKPVERQTTHDMMRVGKILVWLGWTKKHTRIGKWWEPPGVSTCDPGVTASEAEGGHAETRGNGHDQTPVTTFSSHTHRPPDTGVYQNYGNGGQGGHGGHTGPDAPPVGTVIDGYRYSGGDPSLEANWELAL